MRQRSDNLTHPAFTQSRVVTPSLRAGKYFPHSCHLYRPARLVPEEWAQSEPVDRLEAAERLEPPPLTYVLAARAVPCFMDSLPETDAPGLAGRTQSDNLFTLDVIYFRWGTPVADTWAMVFLGPGPDAGDCWLFQGNPQTLGNGVNQSVQGLRTYAKRTKKPPGVE